MTNPTSRVVDLTPELAAELLARNPKNRNFSTANYGKVRRAMERGEWQLNGEAIKVGVSGFILDGQHRCRAVVETGITIRTFLTEGLPDETQDTMDTGKTRSLADVLQIRGESNANGLAAVIKKFLSAERYGFTAAFTSNLGGYPLTNHECLEWLDQNPWCRDYVTPGKAIGRTSIVSGAVASFLIRKFDDIDADDSVYFWARFMDGVNLGPTHPIYVLRKTLKTISDDTRGERNQRYISALVIKAWNAYRDGKEIAQLRFRVGGASPESFPEPK